MDYYRQHETVSGGVKRPFSPIILFFFFFKLFALFPSCLDFRKAPVWPDASPISGPGVGVKGDLEGPVPQGLDVPSYSY